MSDDNERKLARELLTAVCGERGFCERDVNAVVSVFRAHDAAKAKPEAQEMSQEERWAWEIYTHAYDELGYSSRPERWEHSGYRDQRFMLKVLAKSRELFGTEAEQQRKRAENAEVSLTVAEACRVAAENERDDASDEVKRLSTNLAAIVQLPRQYGYEQAAGEQPVEYLRRVLADMRHELQKSVEDLAESRQQAAAEAQLYMEQKSNATEGWAKAKECGEEIERLSRRLDDMDKSSTKAILDLEEAKKACGRKGEEIDRLKAELTAAKAWGNQLQLVEGAAGEYSGGRHEGETSGEFGVRVLHELGAQLKRAQNRVQELESNVPPAPPQQPDGDELAKLLMEVDYGNTREQGDRAWLEAETYEKQVQRGRSARLLSIIDARADAKNVEMMDYLHEYVKAEFKRRKVEPKPDDAAPVKVEDDRKTGIYQKFKVSRVDGTSAPGGKHEHCRCYVLDWEHDKFTIPAMRAYADVCQAEYPELAKDIKTMIADAEIREGRALP